VTARTKAPFAVAALVALAVATFAFRVERAQACGGFFPSTLSEKRRPSLALEQALLIYDQKSRREHFVREVAFRRATEPFGFVVPTPGRPDVAAIQKSPFRDLRQTFGFGSPVVPGSRGGDVRAGTTGGGAASAGVTLLDVKNVGSFTAFVLAATDENALSSWLAQQRFVRSPETSDWLSRYVRLGFYFVAMRYEPKPEAPGTKLSEPGAAKSETMRISFDSPLPYYPYFEPDRATAPDELRMLDLWVASDGAFEPVSLLERDGARHWVRPFRAGDRHERVQAKLASVIEPELWRLLPAGTITVTTYQDQKVSRRGFGDVLFVPERAPVLEPTRRSELLRLLPLVDPELLPARSGSPKP
jgi:hypothetical protein